VIGYELLSGFVLRIDYPHRRLWLRRSGEPRTTVFGMDYGELRRSGVLLASYLGWYRVAHVFPGSLAEQRGLRVDDRIERVGRNPGGLTEKRILRPRDK
jgi:C-terminal processing protease CtpA/Prc